MAICITIPHILFATSVVAFSTCSASSSIPCSADIVWEGRVSFQESGSQCIAAFDWNAVTFYTKVSVVTAGVLTADLQAGGKAMWLPIGMRHFNFTNRFIVKILDAATKEIIQETKIELPADDDRLNITLARIAVPGMYVISCRKMNQPNLVIGTPFIEPKPIRIYSFHASGGVSFMRDSTSLRSLLFPSGRKLEVWGASDTSGFGTDLQGDLASNKEACENEAAEITNAYQNADLAYGALLARHFGAEFHLQAVAGIGAERNAKWTEWWFKTFIKWLSLTGVVSYMQPMPHYFGNTFGTAVANTNDWSYEFWKPDLILLMLGGNDKVCDDATGKVTMPESFVDTYIDALAKIFQTFEGLDHTPVVVSICGFSSKSEAHTCNRNSACDEVSKAAAAFNERFGNGKRMNHFVEIPVGVVPNNAIHGCAGHRTAEGQKAVAEYLIPMLGKIMSWQSSESIIST